LDGAGPDPATSPFVALYRAAKHATISLGSRFRWSCFVRRICCEQVAHALLIDIALHQRL
jgi:hypothetical protein